MNNAEYLRSCRKTVFTHGYLRGEINLWHVSGAAGRLATNSDLEALVYGDFRIVELSTSRKRRRNLFKHGFFAHAEFFPFIRTWLATGEARSWGSTNLREARRGGFVFESIDDARVQLALIKYDAGWRLYSEWGQVCNRSIEIEQFRGLMQKYVLGVQRKAFKQWGIDMAPMVSGSLKLPVAKPASLKLISFPEDLSPPARGIRPKTAENLN